MKRQTVLDVVGDLPSKFELEDLFERLLVVEKIEKGLEQAKNGKTITHEKVVQYFNKKRH